MNQDFQDVLSALLRAGARFLVVGAHAMAVHGAPGSDLKQIGGVIWEIRPTVLRGDDEGEVRYDSSSFGELFP